MRQTPEAETWRRLQGQDRLQAFLARRAPATINTAGGPAGVVPASSSIALPDPSPSPRRNAGGSGDDEAVARADEDKGCSDVEIDEDVDGGDGATGVPRGGTLFLYSERSLSSSPTENSAERTRDAPSMYCVETRGGHE